MVTINLAKPWTYRSIERTIDYPAGEHTVAPEVAEAADEAGVLAAPETPNEEATDGAADKPAASRAKGAADPGES